MCCFLRQKTLLFRIPFAVFSQELGMVPLKLNFRKKHPPDLANSHTHLHLTPPPNIIQPLHRQRTSRPLRLNPSAGSLPPVGAYDEKAWCNQRVLHPLKHLTRENASDVLQHFSQVIHTFPHESGRGSANPFPPH
mmetsp:Transcript_28311/g.66163  ORF Transcript_28311/g.66163 Transcript_28311/m.66163 type:complete len:135 (-) Transcript_28311:351-755(-)